MELAPATIVKIVTDLTGFLPGAKDLHDLLVAHQAEAAALIPVLANLGEAPSALAAAEKAAPKLTTAVKGLLATVTPPATPNVPPLNPQAHVNAKTESFMRSLGGLGKMTQQQEIDYMNHAAIQSEDSRSGSG